MEDHIEPTVSPFTVAHLCVINALIHNFGEGINYQSQTVKSEEEATTNQDSNSFEDRYDFYDRGWLLALHDSRKWLKSLFSQVGKQLGFDTPAKAERAVRKTMKNESAANFGRLARADATFTPMVRVQLSQYLNHGLETRIKQTTTRDGYRDAIRQDVDLGEKLVFPKPLSTS
jgi:hypothetical protein